MKILLLELQGMYVAPVVFSSHTNLVSSRLTLPLSVERLLLTLLGIPPHSPGSLSILLPWPRKLPLSCSLLVRGAVTETSTK